MLALLRVLTVGNMYPPHHLGGYELVWRGAVEHLRAGGHLVRVLTTDFWLAEPDASLAEDPDVHRELRWYWRDHRFPRMGPAAVARLERHNARCFDRHLEEFKPDVVSWWAMGGMSLSLISRARRRGLPALGVVHDDWPIYGPKVDVRSRFARPRRRLEEAARWSFNSRLQQRRVGWPGRIDRPGIDARLFRQTEPSDWRWRLLCCGRLDRRKGIDLAVSALVHLPQATLRVVGDGDREYRDALERLALELGVRERLALERRDREHLPAVYAEADALLFPVRWQEPWGLVPLESMAVGRPVVASGRGGSGEYLRAEDNCLLVDVDAGAQALADAVRRLAADPTLRARLRAAGLTTASLHTEQRFNRGIEAAIEEAVAR